MADIQDLVRTDFKAVDKRDGLNSVMGWVWGDSDAVPIVEDNGKPFGIVNDRALATRHLDHHAKVENYTTPTRALSSHATLAEAMAHMAEFRAAYLPVEEKGKTLGFVHSVDLLRKTGLDWTAGDLCVPVASLREGQTFGAALHLMRQEYVDFLPVYDAQGRLRWVLPRRMVLRMEAQAGEGRGRKDAGGDKVSFLDDRIESYCDEAVTLPADAGGDRVLRALEEWGYACVVDGGDGRLRGIVTPETIPRVQSRGGLRRR